MGHRAGEFESTVLIPVIPQSIHINGLSSFSDFVYFSLFQFFSLMDVIVSLVCAGFNAETTGGSKGLSFAAIWSSFIVIAYAIIGSIAVYSANGANLFTVGNLIGMGAMLSQLFFVLMWVFFYLGQKSAEEGLGTDLSMHLARTSSNYYYFRFNWCQ